jgi:cellulose synthase operon protein C
VVALLQQAIAANAQSPTARLALVTHHLRNKDPRAAVTAAQDAVAALPKDARVLEMLSVAQEAAGDTALATESLNRLVQMRPGIAEPLLRLAALAARTGNNEKAIDALVRAQKVAPRNTQIDRDLVAMYLTQGKPDQALKQARDLQARTPSFAGGLVLEGDVQLTQKKFGEAERAYRSALKLEPASGILASKVAASLYSAGKTADGDAFARKWLADNPRDAQLRMLMADRAMRGRDFPKAVEHYQALLALDSNNVVALNNLAWIGGETGDPKALVYAERAAKLAPQNASVLDTLGTLLVKQGETTRGLETLAQARALAPTRFDLRLSQARALVATGQKDAARKTLREIVDAKEDFAEKRAAAEMLQKL